MANDPAPNLRKPTFRGFYVRGKRGLLPSTRAMARSVPRYLARGYHPSQEGSTEQAVAYLASSPAAVAADRGAA
jgi:predicted metal-dependent hydrolase